MKINDNYEEMVKLLDSGKPLFVSEDDVNWHIATKDESEVVIYNEWQMPLRMLHMYRVGTIKMNSDTLRAKQYKFVKAAE